jgi:4-hydroxy-3-polyprenylbenzoate decarboxylase
MTKNQKHIVIGITGASGSIYAKSLIENLIALGPENNIKIEIILSDTAIKVCKFELGENYIVNLPLKTYSNDDYFASFASGSSVADAFVVVPCTMGTLGRIAHGTSDNLICRTADVVLKERKQLILVTRETPLNIIHIKNMELVTLAGGIILPASPSFYLNPQTIEELVGTVTNRIIDLLNLKIVVKRWGE